MVTGSAPLGKDKVVGGVGNCSRPSGVAGHGLAPERTCPAKEPAEEQDAAGSHPPVNETTPPSVRPCDRAGPAKEAPRD
ncbi:hypothetical protein GCM10022222_63250 [Amycolatopsis ultiminotia]|uniref:Uncharacterized protein n=1 Tax=Amycolatopsis ultiminotia TaxID=543629 RepID=A0ABP6XQ47_9PSEU